MEINKDRLPQERINPELKKFANIKIVLKIIFTVISWVFYSLLENWMFLEYVWLLFSVAFFGLLYALVIHLENKTFKALFDLPEFDFWIREWGEFSKKWRNLFLLTSIILVFVLPALGLTDPSLSVIWLVVLGILYFSIFQSGSGGPLLHFCDKLIMREGKTKEFFFWSEFEEIEDSPEDEYFELVFKDGERIKIGYEPYYTQDLGRKKIFQYIEAILAKEKSNDL